MRLLLLRLLLRLLQKRLLLLLRQNNCRQTKRGRFRLTTPKGMRPQVSGIENKRFGYARCVSGFFYGRSLRTIGKNYVFLFEI